MTDQTPLGFTLQTSLNTGVLFDSQGPVNSTTGTTLNSTVGGAQASARGGWADGLPTIGTFISTSGVDLDGDQNFASAIANIPWTFQSATLAPGTEIVAHFNLHFDATMQTDSMRTVDTRLGIEVLDLGGTQVVNLFHEEASLTTTSDGTPLLGDYAGMWGTSFSLNEDGIAVASRDRELVTANLTVGSTYIFSLELSTWMAGGIYGGTLSSADALNTLGYSFTGATLGDYTTPADVSMTSPTAAVPESASTVALLGLASLGLVLRSLWPAPARRERPN